jgi:uncharacterized protein (UPF0333 family)
MIDDFIKMNIKNLLDEKINKDYIKFSLFFLNEEDNFITIPQDYKAEFRQTGSGKSIFSKSNRLKATQDEINRAKHRIIQAINAAKDYRNAYKNGTPDNNGVIHFKTIFMGQEYNCKIPPQFKQNLTANNDKTDYLNYFNIPEVGDGAMQIALDKSGKITATNTRSKTDISNNPNLSAASDAGYNKDFNGSIKYFNVKVGAMGKYQGESQGYSVFPTPAIDANVKANIAFRTDIIDFMQGGGSYTTDDKGQELSNAMEFKKKIEKIRKDAEMKIGKPISSNKIWMNWKDQLVQQMDTPEKQATLDTEQSTREFLKMYQSENPINNQPLSMPSDEMDQWEKEQKEKAARLAAARLRMGKNR